MKATNTSPLVFNGKKLSRRFLGNVHPENCIEKNELQAYLKGHTHYHYKTDQFGNSNKFEVRQEYFYQ